MEPAKYSAGLPRRLLVPRNSLFFPVTSTVDIETIGGFSLLTDGYTAEYGDRISGVLDMQTKTASQGKTQNSVELSLLNAHAFSMGTFNNNKGSWLVSVSRGYLDIITKLTAYDRFTPLALL